MEKKIASVIRWLERCIRSYKTGSTESALMDIECARADMDRLRNEMWTLLNKKYAPQRTSRHALTLIKAMGAAMAAVLLTATPLHVLPLARSNVPAAQTSLEWVTPDERSLLSNLRKSLSEWNTAAALPAAKAVPADEKSTARKAVRQTKNDDTEQKRQFDVRTVQSGVTYDNILSLVKTGEKALKHETPTIKIDNGIKN